MKTALLILILSLPSFSWTRIAGADNNNCNVTLNDVGADRIWVVVSHSSSPSTPTDSGVSNSNTWVQAVSSTNTVGVEIWYTSNFPANTGSVVAPATTYSPILKFIVTGGTGLNSLTAGTVTLRVCHY
jgi:hypothetical protein